MTREEMIDCVAGHLHAGQIVDAGRILAEFSGQNPRRVDEAYALRSCKGLLDWLLNRNRYPEAAHILWNDRLFTYKPRCTKMIWRNVEDNNSLMLMGAASMSKSYGAGVWMFLDWIRDPEYTNINLVGPSEDHLKDNLFTHLVTLHRDASLPMPGFIGDLFIGLDSKSRKGAIRGVIIPIGKRPSGRLQGRKRVPRKEPHPFLGTMSRIRFFLDEAEKIPSGIWKDIDNVFSNLTDDRDGFKLILSFNPEDPVGPVAVRCEPVKGWLAVDEEKDEEWVSKRGWKVLRLDAAKCENVIEGKEIYPGLQTREGYNRIIQNAGGKDSPGCWTMARALFPRAGAIYSLISDLMVENCKRNLLFAEDPKMVAGVDCALEGGDPAKIALGRFGKAIGYRLDPSPDFPGGRKVLFKDRWGKPLFRWGLQVDKIDLLEKGDTVKVATEIRKVCLMNHVGPECLMLDRTGNGAGIHDLLKSMWSMQVMGVNYMDSATARKILEEDSKTAEEEYERAVTELWFALKKWMEFNFIAFGPVALTDDVVKQLVGRRYDASRHNRVESKKEFKERNSNQSPNDADALTLLLHGVRTCFGVVPSALDHATSETIVGFGPTEKLPIPLIEDETNRYIGFEDLDDEEMT